MVGKMARISDFELAKRRPVGDLERLTRPDPASSPTMRTPHTVGSSLLSLPTQTDIHQAAEDFIAAEVEEGNYMFFPSHQSVHSDSRKGSDQGAKLSGGGEAVSKTVPPTKRIFLHNPLHDYESIWWIVIWFIFSCEPEGVSKRTMVRARNKVYKNRSATLQGRGINHACELLPTVLQPLGKILVEIKDTLIYAYQSFEETFDGSEMLLVFGELRGHLLALEEQAKGLTPKLPTKSQRLESNPAHKEGQGQQGQQVAEYSRGTGDQPADVDNPFTDSQAGGSLLGKRGRVAPLD